MSYCSSRDAGRTDAPPPAGTFACVQVGGGGGNVSTPAERKIQYDNVGRGNAGQTVTINVPVSIDAKSGNACTSTDGTRREVRLAKNVPGASINETTGEITFHKIPAGTCGTVWTSLRRVVDYPVTCNTSSGGMRIYAVIS